MSELMDTEVVDWMIINFLPHEAELRTMLRRVCTDPGEVDHVIQETCYRILSMPSLAHILEPKPLDPDCIAIKSGKNRDTQFGPTRNVVIQNCIMNSGHGGVTLGSEMAAGIEHVYAQKIEFRNAHGAIDPLGTAIRLKTNMNRGGFLRHLYVRDVVLPNGVDAREKRGRLDPANPLKGRPQVAARLSPSIATTRRATMACGSYSCYQAVVILGLVAANFNGPAGTAILPVTNISITDCDFGMVRNADKPMFVHNAREVVLKNVKVNGKIISQKLQA